MTDAIVGLADAIAALRGELLAAMGEGQDELMRFRLAPVDLTLQVAVTKEAGGKVGWHVLGLGASYEAATTQTLALRLEPVWRNDDGSYTSDFTISDQALQQAHFGPKDTGEAP
jgi:Trypsin-co-occurring domain 2